MIAHRVETGAPQWAYRVTDMYNLVPSKRSLRPGTERAPVGAQTNSGSPNNSLYL